MEDVRAFLIRLLILILPVCWIHQCCKEEDAITAKEINGYKVLKLEDGHWYLRSGRGALEHYIECPKCNSKKTK